MPVVARLSPWLSNYQTNAENTWQSWDRAAIFNLITRCFFDKNDSNIQGTQV